MAHLIQGNEFVDQRGTLRFFNDFDMSDVVRFYEIAPIGTEVIRAWQGHKREKKWFRCLTGSFIINVVKIDNFDNPSHQLTPQTMLLTSKKNEVLAVPNGYATGIKATKEHSRLQVFSDFDLEASKNDDQRFPLDMWNAKWQ